jgi:putative hydrolase
MSDSQPPFGDGSDPFSQIPFLGDIGKLLGGMGGGNQAWDAARQLAVQIATGGTSEANVDPSDRIALDDLYRVAELQVANATGLDLSGALPRLVAVTPGDWAQRSLAAYRPSFEALSGALAAPANLAEIDPAAAGDPAFGFMANLMGMLQPMMIGMAAGSMVGHLAGRVFGTYDLPIPRQGSTELLVVPAHIRAFADSWELPVDDVRLWVLISELTTHRVLAVPHIGTELGRLIEAYCRGFRSNPMAIQERMEQASDGNGDPMQAMQQAFGDPDVLLGAMRTPEQHETGRRLDALVALVIGLVDRTLDQVGTGLIGSYGRLSEALRRRRVEQDTSDAFVTKLLGLSLGTEQVERGNAFVSGVIERAGADGLNPLWTKPEAIPTPNELDAPGLWLARIEFL